MITRYDCIYKSPVLYIGEVSNGRFVKYFEHKRMVKELENKLKCYLDEIDRLSTELNSIDDY